jgi:hypothetical protein
MVTLAGLEPTSPAPVKKDARSPLSYSVIVIFMTVYGGARADTCKHAASRRRGPIKEQDACFVVRDHGGQAISYVYFWMSRAGDGGQAAQQG